MLEDTNLSSRYDENELSALIHTLVQHTVTFEVMHEIHMDMLNTYLQCGDFKALSRVRRKIITYVVKRMKNRDFWSARARMNCSYAHFIPRGVQAPSVLHALAELPMHTYDPATHRRLECSHELIYSVLTSNIKPSEHQRLLGKITLLLG